MLNQGTYLFATLTNYSAVASLTPTYSVIGITSRTTPRTKEDTVAVRSSRSNTVLTVLVVVAGLAVAASLTWLGVQAWRALRPAEQVPTSVATSAAASPTPSATPTALRPRTCLSFEEGAPACVDGLTWSAHSCWLSSSGASLQTRLPSGVWRTVARARVVPDSQLCSRAYPVEVSAQMTEPDPGTFVYRFYNNADSKYDATPGDPFTVTVTR